MKSKQHLDIFETPFHNPSIFEIRSRTQFDGALTDFCVPANSYFPTSEMIDLIHENMGDILKYYPDYSPVHQQCISKLCGIPEENIVAANGITEIITILCRDSNGPILTPVPTFGRWTDLPPEFNVPVHFIQRDKEKNFMLSAQEIIDEANRTKAGTVVICNPNNPTGAWFTEEEINKLVTGLKHINCLIIDESFIEFSDLESAEKLAIESENVVVVKSMGKSLGCHGVRLGYAVANTSLAHIIRTQVPYWNINGLAAFILKSISRYLGEYDQSFIKTAADREYMFQQLKTVPGLKTYPSKCNFLLSELPKGVSGKEVRDILLDHYGIVTRECSNKVGSTETFLRNVVRRSHDTDKLVTALREVVPALVKSENSLALKKDTEVEFA